MARYCPLYSGSSGNCTYVGGADGGILIDAGVSARRIEAALQERQIEPRSIGAVFITHEHADHIAGLELFSRRYGCAVYATGGTRRALPPAVNARCAIMIPCKPEDGPFLEGVVRTSVQVAGMEVSAFNTTHDCNESCGYVIKTADDRKVAVVTDLGEITDTVRQWLDGCDLIHIEANHDPDMLRRGSYPFRLKQRIISPWGHLSNRDCADEVARLGRQGSTRFILAHLSRDNNTPALAYETVRGALTDAGLQPSVDYILRVAAPQDTEGILLF